MRCDSHVHVVAPVTEHPQIEGRTFVAEAAPLEALAKLGATCGIDHFVITQPSFYGTDNTVLLQSLKKLGGRGRGVVVIDPYRDATLIKEWRSEGVAGLRANIYSPAASAVGHGSDDLRALTALADDAGLHVEIISPIERLLEHADFIIDSGVTTVIDHYALYGDIRPDSRSGQKLLTLLSLPHVWMKLSSPYRHASTPMNTEPDREWLEAFLAVAPGRCVWGSDWPHPPPHDAHGGPNVTVPWRPLSYRRLFDDFARAVGDQDSLGRILWGNPAKLYGFVASTTKH
ncbi:amidohydrolase family protein [Sinorhizobium medicae]|uniref:amidohydrolase family protein n=1 Tax=Sinorhizobium medicae TaxID=110321 RepID=UPI00040F8370|nr:amidohydrolase family protein [Sinorhizobium medicae]